ncbi:MAG: Homoserine dehydrogenase [uncultured bacterium]|nr:MAG: Homoserine dehydrogenase [uncultured bacterium]
MQSVGFINLPAWQADLQKILTNLGREDLLRIPVLGRENVEKPWVAFESGDFFAAVETGIHFAGNGNLKRLPATVITTDAELAINRLLHGDYQKTRFSAAVGGIFAFLRTVADDYAVGCPDKLFVQNDSVAGYILSKMETVGKTLEEAIHEVQWEGIATDNPSQNLHGIVTRNRLILQIASVFGLIIRPETVNTLGISTLSCEDVTIARELGCSIRLLGLAQVDSDRVCAVVEPCLIPSVFLIAQARAGSEIVYLQTTSGNSHVYSGPGSSYETQVRAILSDLVSCTIKQPQIAIHEGAVEDFSDSFYLRLSLINMNDTLAQILQLFNRAGVEIDKIHQPAHQVSRETAEAARQNLVLITGKTRRIVVEAILTQISEQIRLASVRSCFRFIRRA